MANQPVTRKGHRTRDKILEAARRVFARDGYVAARMSDVVSASGLSTGAVYRYFRDKEDLFAAVIGDLHEELFRVSRSEGHDFSTEPFEALLQANRNYLADYYQNRDILRAFYEAANVNTRFAAIARRMRQRHVDRFVRSVRRLHGITSVDGVDVEVAVEALACMVEQSAYVWYAHEEEADRRVSVDDAAFVVTVAWYRTVFGEMERRVPAPGARHDAQRSDLPPGRVAEPDAHPVPVRRGRIRA